MDALTFCQRFQKYGLDIRDVQMLSKFMYIDDDDKRIILRTVAKVRPKRNSYFKKISSNKAEISPLLLEMLKIEAKSRGYKVIIIKNV